MKKHLLAFACSMLVAAPVAFAADDVSSTPAATPDQAATAAAPSVDAQAVKPSKKKHHVKHVKKEVKEDTAATPNT
jgi:hypothetical protein